MHHGIQKLLLLGAGHAHLHVLASLARQRPADLDVTLLTPYPHQTYSGMTPGFVAGHYSEDEGRIALEPLVRAAGVTWVRKVDSYDLAVVHQTLREAIARLRDQFDEAGADRPVIALGLRWLEREEPDYQEVAAALQRVNRDAAHAGNVITRIRGFLKKEGLKRERVDVRGMINALLQMLRRTLDEAGVIVELRLAPDLPDLLGDQVQLQQVVLNLLVNAVDAMRLEDGRPRRIVIAVQESPACGLLFTVEDSGPGIPESMSSAIFEAFCSTKSDGLGMGLAISKSIIENHGGSLWLDASGPKGARFAFCLPVSSP